MGTTRSFQDMLNEFIDLDLLIEDTVKRDYYLSKVKRNDKWLGGTIPVPFQAARATDIRFGSLVATSDVGNATYVRGEVSAYKELWGSLKFNHTDLVQHGKVSEQNFLRMLPDQLNQFQQYMRESLSVSLLGGYGGALALATADGDSSGNITVRRPELFQINQRVTVDDDNSSPATGFVRTINMSTGVLTIYDARTGGSVVDLSGYTTAQNAKIYLYDADTSGNRFQSVIDALLSAANGGGSTLHGQTKASYPALQAYNVSGSAITVANILEKFFSAWLTTKRIGKGNPTEIWVSYDVFGAVLKALQSLHGAYNVVPGSEKTSEYGWTEVMIGGPAGALKIVAINEMPDNCAPIIDWNAFMFYSNGFFAKRENPDTGATFYESRDTTGFSYIVDIACMGENVVKAPSYCGIIYSIPVPIPAS